LLIDTRVTHGFNCKRSGAAKLRVLGSSRAVRCRTIEPGYISDDSSDELNLSEGFLVNKTELIDHIAKHADISKAAATRALEATIGAVKTTLKKGGTVSLVGFGTFAVGKRAARAGRNPRTGAAIKIKAAKVPKFRPGKALKDALN
jgi:DNA-binding protein HU-beta